MKESNPEQPLKEAFDQARAIGEDQGLTAKEAAQQVLGGIRADYAAASDYTRARKRRKEAVARHLSDLRKERGLKQQEVARQTGINVVTLSGYEIGKSEPNLEALVRLADVYGVTLDELMCREVQA